jgi:hypothetical protein
LKRRELAAGGGQFAAAAEVKAPLRPMLRARRPSIVGERERERERERQREFEREIQRSFF